MPEPGITDTADTAEADDEASRPTGSEAKSEEAADTERQRAG
jgi:hypothetical protein